MGATGASELLDAVDALTKPVTEHIAQKDDNGKWLGVHTVTGQSLLEQMHAAVWPSGNRDTGSASQPGTRAPVDVDALYAYVKMAGQIGDWCRMAGLRASRDAVADLRAWYVERLKLVDPNDDFYISMLTGWAHTIRRHLHPPKSFVVAGTCPVCGKRDWEDGMGGGGTFPITVEYSVDDEGATYGERAICRACQPHTMWIGKEAVEELGEELEEKEATRSA